MERRKFVKKGIVGIGSLALLSGLYTWQIEPFWLEFVKKKMPIANLSNSLIGKTVMQISDAVSYTHLTLPTILLV